MHRTFTRGWKLWPRNKDTRNVLNWGSLKLCIYFFPYIYTTLLCMLNTLIYQDVFFKYFYKDLCFQLKQDVTWTDGITHAISHKWGKFGSLYLFCEDCDQSFLLCFFKKVLGKEHSGNVPKKIFRQFVFLRNHLKEN